MNTRTLASILAIVLLLAPAITPVLAVKAAAQQAQFTVEVVPSNKLNYNILLIKIKGVPSNKPPAVTATLYDKNGNPINPEPYMLIAGYVATPSGNEWHVYIALNKTFKEGVFGWKYANTSGTKIELSDGTEYTISQLGKVSLYTANLANPAPLSRTSPLLALNGKTVANITNLTDGRNTNINITASNITEVWPLVNAITCDSSIASIKVVVEAGDLGTQTVTIEVGPAGLKVKAEEYYSMAPEKPVEVTVAAPTLAADPTAANSLAASNTTTIPQLWTNATTKSVSVFNSNNAPAAFKAALLEAGATNPLTVSLELSNGGNWLALNVSASNIPSTGTLYVVMKLNITAYNTTRINWTTELNTYTALNSATSEKTIFNLTGIDLSNLNATITVKEFTVVFIPANITVNINGWTDRVNGNVTVGGKTFNETGYALDYAAITSADADAGSPDFKVTIYMPGRGEMPSYDLIKETYGVNNAPVVVELTDVNGETSRVTGFIKLETGKITVTPSTVKPGETLTVKVEDIDAASAPVTIELLNENGGTIASGSVSLKQVEEGVFTSTLRIVLGRNAGIDADKGIIYVNQMVKTIKLTYTDKYGAGASIVDRVASVEVAFWPVEVKAAKPEVGVGQPVELIVTSANYNVDSGKREELLIPTGNVMVTREYIEANLTFRGLRVARIIVYAINHTTSKPIDLISQNVDSGKVFIVRDFFETAPDTGEYKIWIYTANLSFLKEGDKIKVVYEDLLNNKNYTVEVTVKRTLGEIHILYNSEEVNLAENGIPVAAAGTTVIRSFTILVVDPDANKKISDQDTVTLYVEFIAQNGTTLISYSVSLSETDVSTGNFTGTLILNWTSSNFNVTVVGAGAKRSGSIPLEDMVFGKLVIKYYDESMGENVTYEIPVRTPYTAELTIEPAEAETLNDNVTITLEEKDLDIVPGAGNDRLPANLSFAVSYPQGTGTLTVATIEGAGYEFEEVKPGVFQVTLPASTLLQLATGNARRNIGVQVTLSYTDPAARGSVMGSLVSYTSEAVFRVKSHTAEVTVEPSRVSPFGIIRIKIHDPDLAGLTPDNVVRQLSVTASTAGTTFQPVAVWPVSGAESPNGTFIFQVRLNGQTATPSDTVVVAYTDQRTAEGTARPILRYVEVYTETATVEVYSEAGTRLATVTPGSVVELRVRDFDANTNPFGVNTVNVIVWSSELPVRKTITLVETSEDSGVFTNVLRLTDTITTDVLDPSKPVIYVKPGATLYIEYTDRHPANQTQPLSIRVSVPVVRGAPVTMPAVPRPENAKLLDPATLRPITAVKVGRQALLVIPVENRAEQKVEVYAVVTVYKNGVPVAFAFSVGVLEAATTTDLPVALPALKEPGTYTVKIVFIDSLERLTPLSRTPVELTLTVTS